MQRLSSMILFSLMLLLLMTGCASLNEQAMPDQSEGASTGDNRASSAVRELTSASDGAPIPPLDGPTEDLTLIGVTGRPQFLNSYADW
jgi:uncharacterized protein YceK